MARNPISIEVLETLDAIDRRGSFAKAAEELNKATSAISYAVQKLEEQLDIALFQRLGRRSVLTPAGRLILAEGRDILQTTRRLADKAKEIATGWEPRISIGLESLYSFPDFFNVLNEFLLAFPTIEIDISECVLNGGWEALEQGRVDLLVGSPGPVPSQKGYRSVAIGRVELVPVIAAKHVLAAHVLAKKQNIDSVMGQLRRIVIHDTSFNGIVRSEGLSSDGQMFYVQNMDQKIQAILAGIGIGNLPKHRIQGYLDKGVLLPLGIKQQDNAESFLAWKISNKGKGLRALTETLIVK
ncbi:LysR family transcriptional regulator [Paraglaciecola sp. MB-3u-78]|uniref:LysR family transcriptional regulator n=1 Tax=Paraglaciecola sp. MB-3u-78 TaxID=2058332 RepID=UPI000C31EF79|nr:LysR family transcriptional regulator [Paraglaciecola sp. MB-3u-78]PKH00266.1 LysR family transcriptional regulator [Paraglaciecola sp. MB-3u-78]